MSMLDNFTAEQIALLQQELAARLQGDGDRSPFRPRQLHDLRLAPTATDPRPTFFWSAEAPRNALPARPLYRKLFWHRETGKEITVKSAEEAAKLDAALWTDIPPIPTVLTAAERAQQLFESLSPEDQALVLEQEKARRVARVSEALSDLSDGQIERVTGRKKAKKTA